MLHRMDDDGHYWLQEGCIGYSFVFFDSSDDPTSTFKYKLAMRMKLIGMTRGAQQLGVFQELAQAMGDLEGVFIFINWKCNLGPQSLSVFNRSQTRS